MDKQQASGLRSLIDSRVINHERLPMLEVVCERMVRTFSTSMRNLISDGIEVTLQDMQSVRFDSYMSGLLDPSMIAVFKVPAWRDYGLVVVDQNLIYAIVDALLGGRRGGASNRIEARKFTPIETNLVSKMVELMLNDLSAAFQPIAPVSIEMERVETSPRFAAIAGPTNICTTAKFNIDMDGRGGAFTVLLPSALLEPIRGKLTQRFMGEKLGGDTTWQDHMESEIRQTELELSAILGEIELGLGSVRNLQVGQTLTLDTSPDTPIDVQCGGVSLGRAHMGRERHHIAISMIDGIERGQN
ncbi:flagellar motor switch protein FliM [Erythrobacter aureus]|nr:flagellar motor switch protein FliM [Erythrobacter aureus]